MKTLERIFEEVSKTLQTILELNNKEEIVLSSNLLGENGMMDSLTVIAFITWCDDYYNIDLLEDDLELECLQTVETLIHKINVKL